MKIEIQAHCSDSFYMTIKKGKKKIEYNGYVPNWLGGDDDVQLTIDNETGRIEGWEPLTDAQIEEIENGDEDGNE